MFHLAKGKTKNSIHSVQRCFCVFVNDPQLATAQSGELLEQLQRGQASAGNGLQLRGDLQHVARVAGDRGSGDRPTALLRENCRVVSGR